MRCEVGEDGCDVGNDDDGCGVVYDQLGVSTWFTCQIGDGVFLWSLLMLVYSSCTYIKKCCEIGNMKIAVLFRKP